MVTADWEPRMKALFAGHALRAAGMATMRRTAAIAMPAAAGARSLK
jgi:hypothetical protein